MILIDLLKEIKLYRHCVSWSRQYSLINKKTILPLFLSILLSYPKGSYQELFILYKLSQSILVSDDIIDDRLFGFQNLDKDMFLIKKKYVGLKGEYITMIDSIKKDLLSIFSKEHVIEWEGNMKKMLACMILETRECQDLDNSLEEYLLIGKQSVGLYMYNHVLAQMMLKGKKNDVNTIIDYSSAFIRLSNDLRSYDRELREGKTNSITIVIDSGVNKELAMAEIKIKAQNEYNKLLQLKVNDEDVCFYKKNVLRYIDFIDKFYLTEDFRENKTMSFLKLLFYSSNSFGHE